MQVIKNPESEAVQKALENRVWICLCGRQRNPNVLPLRRFKPKKVYLLHSNDGDSTASAESCKAFFEKNNIKAKPMPIDDYDMIKISKIVKSIASKVGPEELALNWTGGTKPMSLASYNTLSDDIPKLYYDSRHGYIISLTDSNPKFDLGFSNVTIKDLVMLNDETISDVKGTEIILVKNNKPFDFPIYPEASRFLLDNVSDQESINHVTGKYRQKLRKWNNDNRTSLAQLCLPFKTTIEQIESIRSEFSEKKDFFKFMDGIWWEIYVLKKITDALCKISKESFKVYYNVVSSTNSNKDSQNDIAIIHRDILYLIECTTSGVKKQDDNEISYIKGRVHKNLGNAEYLGGAFTRIMMATTQNDNKIDELRSKNKKRRSVIFPYVNEIINPNNCLEYLKNWMGIIS